MPACVARYRNHARSQCPKMQCSSLKTKIFSHQKSIAQLLVNTAEVCRRIRIACERVCGPKSLKFCLMAFSIRKEEKPRTCCVHFFPCSPAQLEFFWPCCMVQFHMHQFKSLDINASRQTRLLRQENRNGRNFNTRVSLHLYVCITYILHKKTSL